MKWERNSESRARCYGNDPVCVARYCRFIVWTFRSRCETDHPLLAAYVICLIALTHVYRSKEISERIVQVSVPACVVVTHFKITRKGQVIMYKKGKEGENVTARTYKLNKYLSANWALKYQGNFTDYLTIIKTGDAEKCSFGKWAIYLRYALGFEIICFKFC